MSESRHTACNSCVAEDARDCSGLLWGALVVQHDNPVMPEDYEPVPPFPPPCDCQCHSDRGSATVSAKRHRWPRDWNVIQYQEHSCAACGLQRRRLARQGRYGTSTWVWQYRRPDNGWGESRHVPACAPSEESKP